MTTEMIRAVAVEAREGYVVRVAFSDGAMKDIDMSGELAEAKGVFKALRDPEVFSQVRVNELSGAVEWPGQIDLDPEVLYGLFEPASGPPMRRRTIREPEPSLKALRERDDSRDLTDEEFAAFEREYGPFLPPDGEG